MCSPHATAQQFCPSLEPGHSSVHSNSWKQWKLGLSEESKSGSCSAAKGRDEFQMVLLFISYVILSLQSLSFLTCENVAGA